MMDPLEAYSTHYPSGRPGPSISIHPIPWPPFEFRNWIVKDKKNGYLVSHSGLVFGNKWSTEQKYAVRFTENGARSTAFDLQAEPVRLKKKEK